jgi:hypothetical protein
MMLTFHFLCQKHAIAAGEETSAGYRLHAQQRRVRSDPDEAIL